ncbi:MAG: DUF502 domain-containing protein [Verrucomicrobiota bacterium]
MSPHESSEKNTFGSRLGHNFLTGLFLLLPIGLTLYVLSVLLDLMGKYAQPLVEIGLKLYWKEINFTEGLPKQGLVVISALLTVPILIVVGYLSKRLFGKLLHRWFGQIVECTPGFGSLYSSIRQMVDALSGRNKEMFRRVVLVEYPRAGCWSIAFLTHEKPEAFSDALGRKVVNVFVPTSPTPTSGFVLQVPPDEIRETKLTVSEAIGLLVSFGAVMPKSEAKE